MRGLKSWLRQPHHGSHRPVRYITNHSSGKMAMPLQEPLCNGSPGHVISEKNFPYPPLYTDVIN